jgi:excisionase family DNA binding protein
MKLLTPKEAAEQIGVSLSTVKAWISREDEPMPSIIVGDTGSHRRIVADLVQPWLENEVQRQASSTK